MWVNNSLSRSASLFSSPIQLCQWCRLESKEGTGQLAANGNDSLEGSDEVEEQGAHESQSKQAAASHGDSSVLPLKSGAAEAETSGRVGTNSATSSTAVSDLSSSYASNSKADESTPAEPQTDDESAAADVLQAVSASGGGESQLGQAARSDQATNPERGSDTSSPVAKSGGPAGMSAGADGSNGDHGDDDVRSVRSQDTNTSRASKIQASEMSRLQVQLAASIVYNHSVTVSMPQA